VSDAERLLVQAGNALKAKNYDDALEFAKECKLALQSARTYREVINALKKSRNKINEMKKIGADVTKAEQILAQAKPALLAKRYDEAMKYAKESLAEAEKCELYKLAIDQVEVAWSKISEVKKLGAQVKVADELLADARNAIKAGEYDKALEQVKRCIENAEHIKQKYQEVVDLVQLAQSKIEETREMGADATVAQEFYDHMTKTIDIGDYEKACEYGKRCIEEALTLQLEQISGIKITGVDDSMAGTDADIDNPTLIRCDLCGADIPEDSVYCSLCGGKINK
jgi:tetratricopeptide (TPR) repeat protein